MNKKLIPIIAVVLIAIAAVMYVWADGGDPNATMTCADCEGAMEPCAICGGAEEQMATCEACGATGTTDTHVACESCDSTGKVPATTPYYGTWMALLAPIIAIVLALVTKEVYSSLIVGVGVGGLLVSNFSPVNTLDNVMQSGFISAVADTAGIFVFLVILGIMVVLVNRAGGSAAFGRWAEKNIKSRAGAAICTFILGVLIFIDDYFNCLTVGGVMRPVTDSHKISRAKLAFIIDATAAPICMIAPISSWAAAVAGYAPDGEGIKLFVQAIPYNLYSILTLIFVVAVILMKVDYGPMKRHEHNALKGDLFTGGDYEKTETPEVSPRGRVIDLVLPVVVLIVSCVLALIYNGGFFRNDGEYFHDFIGAFGNTDATVGLPLGGFVALVITIVYMAVRGVVSFGESMKGIPMGFHAMVPAILILTLATALKNMTGMLGADVYVGGLMEGAAAGLESFLPAIIFLVACGLAFATGTSWGTFGILIPIVISVFPVAGEMQIIGISACLAGAVCGDHCSPISDTTIMSSAGAQCDHVNHVSTQLPYALTVAAVSFLGYILAGFARNVFVVLGVSALLLIGVLFCIKYISKNKA